MVRTEFNKGLKAPVNGVVVNEIVKLASKFEKKIKGTVEVNLVDNSTIKKLNRDHRGKNKVTDVLSFGLVDTFDVFPTDMIGQIYICYPQIKKQAADFGVSEKEEFCRMLVHGLLHIVGYDHVKKVHAQSMFKLQEKIVENARKKKLA